jgi:hypothetical protein
MSAGGAMRWRVVLEVVGAEDTTEAHEVGAGARSPTGHAAATPGLGLEDGKAILAQVQRHLAAAQVEEHCRSRRRCDRCGAQAAHWPCRASIIQAGDQILYSRPWPRRSRRL